MPLIDSEVSNVLKKLSWSNIKATLKTYFDTIYTNASNITSGTLRTELLGEPAYLTGTITKTAKPLFDVLRADRLSFLPAGQIIIEESTDGGNTWVSSGVSDSTKRKLFTGQRPGIYIPLKDGVQSCSCMMRITITGMVYNVPDGTAETDKYGYWNSSYVASTERYCTLSDGWAWVTSCANRIHLKVERATGASPNTWVTDREAFMSGWSGGNYFSLSGSNFGGGTGQTSNYWNWRFTFRTCSPTYTFNDADLSTSYNTNKQTIMHIKATGINIWTTPNYMAYHEHLYNWDENKNALFPAGVSGTVLTSTVATGTAPFTVASTTAVSNLNSDLLDGNHASAFVLHSLATAANDFLIASGAGAFVKKTLAEVKTILGLGSMVAGPASATNNAIVRFDAATGKLVKNSTATIDDNGNLVVTGSLTANGGRYTQANFSGRNKTFLLFEYGSEYGESWNSEALDFDIYDCKNYDTYQGMTVLIGRVGEGIVKTWGLNNAPYHVRIKTYNDSATSKIRVYAVTDTYVDFFTLVLKYNRVATTLLGTEVGTDAYVPNGTLVFDSTASASAWYEGTPSHPRTVSMVGGVVTFGSTPKVGSNAVEVVSNRGVASGYCELDSSAKIPETRIPVLDGGAP
jgi:hypothetical protein